AQNRPAGADRPAEEPSSLPSAIEQQAEEGSLARLLRGREQRDGVLHDQAVPDPRDRLLLGLQPGVPMADGSFAVDWHKFQFSRNKKGLDQAPWSWTAPRSHRAGVCVSLRNETYSS